MTSERISSYLGPQIYTKFSALAMRLQCVNLGQGFPNTPVEDFIRKSLAEEALSESLQYTNPAGHPKLLKVATEFFSKAIGIQINQETEIMVGAGAQTVLVCIFQAILNPKDEVICIDPAFDVYKPMIEFQGAIQRGVALKIKKYNTKEDMLQRYQNGRFTFTEDDEWELDFDLLRKTINEKTKMIIINTPQNPQGKIFSNSELDQLAELLENYPNILICEDAAYHHIPFGNYNSFKYPRCITHQKLAQKTVCVVSAGKMFSATGLRVGFAIGNETIIKGVKASNACHLYCLNPFLQTATAKCLSYTMDCQYFQDVKQFYETQANLLLKCLIDCKLPLRYWVPQGGYFLLTDITNVDIPQQYFEDPEDKQNILSRDYAFAYYVANEFKVVCLPMSPYYENKELGQNLVRWAFCKTTETIQEACKRLI